MSHWIHGKMHKCWQYLPLESWENMYKMLTKLGKIWNADNSLYWKNGKSYVNCWQNAGKCMKCWQCNGGSCKVGHICRQVQATVHACTTMNAHMHTRAYCLALVYFCKTSYEKCMMITMPVNPPVDSCPYKYGVRTIKLLCNKATNMRRERLTCLWYHIFLQGTLYNETQQLHVL